MVISLETAPNIQLFWFALLAGHGYALCNQLASTWARTAALLSHPSSFLSKHPSFCPDCKSDVFFLHMFHITWYSFNGRVQCLCLMKGRVACEWLGRWLSCSCAPCCHHVDHWAALHVSCFVLEFSGELKLPLLCLKVFDYKMQKLWSYLRSSWSVCAARAAAQLGLTGTLFLFII